MGSGIFFALCLALMANVEGNAQRKGTDGNGRRYNRIQHGQCTYTFILPEHDGNCREGTTAADQYNTNFLQRDEPPMNQDFPSQKIQHLEHVMENYTQWLQKLENYIVDNMKSEMVQMQQNAVQNQTATMLEIGTSLLSQTAEQTRKLTDVETQVLNQTSRLEIQLLENSLSTYKLEKQLIQQTHEIIKIHEKNSLLENKVLEMEVRHKVELDTLKTEKETLQGLVSRQNHIIQELEKQLTKATTNNSILQKQQMELMDTVHNLVKVCSKEGVAIKNSKREEEKPFRDCADLYHAGFNKSGVYTIYINNVSDPKKVKTLTTTRKLSPVPTSHTQFTKRQCFPAGVPPAVAELQLPACRTAFGCPSTLGVVVLQQLEAHWLGDTALEISGQYNNPRHRLFTGPSMEQNYPAVNDSKTWLSLCVCCVHSLTGPIKPDLTEGNTNVTGFPKIPRSDKPT